MRFMIIVKGTKEWEAGGRPSARVFNEMGEYHDELAKAGALLDANGLHRSERGLRIQYSGETRRVIDGPFAEAKELIAGFTMIDVKSREEALEWARRFPRPFEGDCEIEVRQVLEPEELVAML